MWRLVLGCALLASATAHAHPSFDPDTIYKVPRGHAPADGPADAPVTIVAWSDYACGYCNKVQHTLEQLARLFPGQLRWVHRTLPLDEDNTLTAEAALAAAAQGRFLPMNDRLYGVHGMVDRPAVELIASELGLDMVRFRADLDTHVYRAQIQTDITDAHALGVSGTPEFFINGRSVHGNQPLSVFVRVVEQELARAGKSDYDTLVGGGRPTADGAEGLSNPHVELERTTTYRVGLGLPGHQAGPDDALVTIVEWSDFQCPYCAKEAPVVAHVRQKYPRDVRIIYRHLPLYFHRDAMLAAEAGVAAAEQGKFWAFHDQVFGNPGQLARGDLEKFGQAAGLEMARFRAALDDRRYHDAVVAETASASALGIDGTPMFFVNGAPIAGAIDADSLDKLIDAHIARVRQAVQQGLPQSDVYALLMSDSSGEERADPSRIPSATVLHIELRSDDRARAVEAACRRQDVARARSLASNLSGDPRRRATLVCAGSGIDLPVQ